MKIKTIISLVLALSICLCFTACTNKNDEAKPYDYDLSEYVTLGEYKGVSYIAVDVAKVTEEDITNEINNEIENNDLMIENKITDRPAQNGDTVNIDYVGLRDGVAFEGGTYAGYDLVLGSNSFIDGFEDGLIGANVGDEVALNLTFPSNYGNAELAGAAVVFNVKINSISTYSYPEITDDLVAQISDYSNVADYKSYVNSYLTENNKLKAENSNLSSVWNTVVKNAKIIKTPEKEHKLYYDIMYGQFEDAAAYNNVTIAEYAKLSNATVADIENYCKNYAEAATEQDLIALAIYKDAGLSMTDSDVTKYSNEIMNYYYCNTKDQVIEILGSEELYDAQLKYFFVLDYLLENANAQ